MSPQCPDIFTILTFESLCLEMDLVIYHLYANVKQWSLGYSNDWVFVYDFFFWYADFFT